VQCRCYAYKKTDTDESHYIACILGKKRVCDAKITEGWYYIFITQLTRCDKCQLRRAWARPTLKS